MGMNVWRVCKFDLTYFFFFFWFRIGLIFGVRSLFSVFQFCSMNEHKRKREKKTPTKINIPCEMYRMHNERLLVYVGSKIEIMAHFPLASQIFSRSEKPTTFEANGSCEWLHRKFKIKAPLWYITSEIFSCIDSWGHIWCMMQHKRWRLGYNAHIDSFNSSFVVKYSNFSVAAAASPHPFCGQTKRGGKNMRHCDGKWDRLCHLNISPGELPNSVQQRTPHRTCSFFRCEPFYTQNEIAY